MPSVPGLAAAVGIGWAYSGSSNYPAGLYRQLNGSKYSIPNTHWLTPPPGNYRR